MSNIVISVDMTVSSIEGENRAQLTSVKNSIGEDITKKFIAYCNSSKISVTDRSAIEDAAVPFIKKYEGASFLP
jgi:hypothetical protein